MANQLLRRPNGTEDVVPREIPKWRTVENVARAAAESFGFCEIRIPTFESTELFRRSVGETTDVVQKEMYTVTARETSYTLRPEGTAGTIRALLQNGLLAEALPQKVYYLLSCFRHERPQAGRLREFHQFGVECAGAKSAYADAEVILLARTILRNLNVQNIELSINSIGCPECRESYREALRNYFEPRKAKLCETCQERLERNPMRILDCKSPVCSEIAKDAPVILDYLCEDCAEHFTTLQKALTEMDVKFTVNPKIVRGLDYYTKTVFEFITTDIGAQGTVCGGGRYDGLIEQMGGQPTPALGFGMGLERLILTMERQGTAFPKADVCDVYLAPMDDSAKIAALKLCTALRDSSLRAETDLVGRGFKAQMKYCNKIGAKYLLVLGSEELSTKRGKLKNMATGAETPIPLEPLEDFRAKAADILLDSVLGGASEALSDLLKDLPDAGKDTAP